MKKINFPYLFFVLKSCYCKIVFALAFILSYFLLPKDIFAGPHRFLALVFMIVFSLSIMCIVRNIKEKIVVSRTYKTSIFSLILTILGFSAFQVCGIGAPICGATVGMGVLSIIFPGVFVNFLTDYSLLVIYISIFLQILGLYFMKCFVYNFRKAIGQKNDNQE